MTSVERSPLDAVHRRAGAKMVPFGGWEMPLEYSGTIDEHLACRRGVVMFDVSHLGTVRVEGDDSYDVLQRAFTNDLAKIEPGRAQYTHLLDDADGSVLDDIIVWWHPSSGGGPAVFDVMPNASNTDRVRAAIGGRETTARPGRDRRPGPDRALDTSRRSGRRRPQVGRFRVAQCTWQDAACTVAGTGYTGEDGVEIAVPADVAESLWDALEAAGVGARRARCPRHAAPRSRAAAARPRARSRHHAAAGRAGLGGRVGQGRVPRTRRARRRTRARRPPPPRRHLDAEPPPAAGRLPDPRSTARAVGEVTSGNYSPVLEHGIALGFVPPDVAIGDDVAIDVRGTVCPAEVVKTPFVGG